MTTPMTDPTEPAEFDAHTIASDSDARAAAQEAVVRGQQAHQALLEAADLVAALAAATLDHAGAAGAGAAGGSTSQQPPRPTAQQRADAQIEKRFGTGRTQPPTTGRPPRARTGQAAEQLARRSFTPREQS